MRLAIFEAMNGRERDQRLWFIVDELDALGAIDGLTRWRGCQSPVVAACCAFSQSRRCRTCTVRVRRRP